MILNLMLLLISQSSSRSYSSTDGEEVLGPLMAFGLIWTLVVVLVILAAIVLQIIMMWKIIGKAGFPGALSLLILIPGLGGLAIFIVFLVMAFSKWPIEKELEDYKMRSYSQGGQTYVHLQSPPPPQNISDNPPPPPPVK
ncbi:MAG: hypothetical protein ACP5FK_04635 [bacterium]